MPKLKKISSTAQRKKTKQLQNQLRSAMKKIHHQAGTDGLPLLPLPPLRDPRPDLEVGGQRRPKSSSGIAHRTAAIQRSQSSSVGRDELFDYDSGTAAYVPALAHPGKDEVGTMHGGLNRVVALANKRGGKGGGEDCEAEAGVCDASGESAQLE
ncbi:hypothetical protein V496_04727 [Pseudogymnoascus sp. VKM F-4515 (FW-2607)]|nr:hypothetical protein V496_04727 [Pseudogymnoascus sp. VKM F-4515 (FW-2607)]KFY96096.1 hypothetical protein V498_02889 [Pseudogymnoascus sp. VKM F-4517 (FW-2822)]